MKDMLAVARRAETSDFPHGAAAAILDALATETRMLTVGPATDRIAIAKATAGAPIFETDSIHPQIAARTGLFIRDLNAEPGDRQWNFWCASHDLAGAVAKRTALWPDPARNGMLLDIAFQHTRAERDNAAAATADPTPELRRRISVDLEVIRFAAHHTTRMLVNGTSAILQLAMTLAIIVLVARPDPCRIGALCEAGHRSSHAGHVLHARTAQTAHRQGASHAVRT
jgi:hypothetical protein